MIMVRQCLFSHRRAAMLLLALLLAMRALIPQGMMAAPAATGGVAVLLCDGSGVAGRMALPLGKKPAKAPQAESCPFGVLADAATDSLQAWLIAEAQPQPALLQLFAQAYLIGATPHPHPPARAPPAAV